MLQLKNPKIAVPVVLFAGLIWSFGPLVVRYMDEPHLIPWQYIFGRGLTIFILLNLYLFFDEGKNFYKNYFKIGLSGLIGGSGLGVAMISFMFSITNTSAAITLLCLAAMPFFTAFLAFLFLREKISLNVWISIIIATVGIVILSNDYVFFSSSYNSSLFSLHGTLVCLGLILYSIGSKAIPAAELTLLSLTEVIGGIFWVWLPLFGINEIPTTNTIIGGFFLFISLTYYSLVMRWNKRYIGLN